MPGFRRPSIFRCYRGFIKAMLVFQGRTGVLVMLNQRNPPNMAWIQLCGSLCCIPRWMIGWLRIIIYHPINCWLHIDPKWVDWVVIDPFIHHGFIVPGIEDQSTFIPCNLPIFAPGRFNDSHYLIYRVDHFKGRCWWIFLECRTWVGVAMIPSEQSTTGWSI